jgi:hypothetical protein
MSLGVFIIIIIIIITMRAAAKRTALLYAEYAAMRCLDVVMCVFVQSSGRSHSWPVHPRVRCSALEWRRQQSTRRSVRRRCVIDAVRLARARLFA